MTSQHTRVTLGPAEDFPLDEMKMVNADGTRLAVIRTTSGIHAIDNACPHQGYGLVTGSLTVEDDGTPIVTCQWHNWKFRADTGECVVGEEHVGCHRVSHTSDGQIEVEIEEPTPAQVRERLWPSLRRGVEADYVGQIARDVARLLAAGAEPAEVLFVGAELGAARNDWGLGHEIALAADCLAIAAGWSGDDVALALTHALAGVSEEIQGHQARPVPEPSPELGTIDGDDASSLLAEAIEAEAVEAAVQVVVDALAAGLDADALLPGFLEAVGAHHLSYGHGAIYVQKTFELIEACRSAGIETAEAALLPHLVVSLVNGTREDVLPYMRPFMASLSSVDVERLAAAPAIDRGAEAATELARTMLDSNEPPIRLAVDAVASGAGVAGLLDAVAIAVSLRMLRHDVTRDAQHHEHREAFTWLDITHGLTYVDAARWLWGRLPSPAAARLALFTVWLLHDTGRHERVAGIAEPDDAEHVSDAIRSALAGEPAQVHDALCRAAMDDRAGSFIVAAHLVKTAHAALGEATATGSSLPLAAAARFIHAPRRERFVARAAAEAADFVRTGRPPVR